MNDCWNVKFERHSGQYQSCMKLYGVPLLPPVLSQECRKEMQYYKTLAKEVEKRILLLQPYLGFEDDPFKTEDNICGPSDVDYEVLDALDEDPEFQNSVMPSKRNNSAQPKGSPKSKNGIDSITMKSDAQNFIIDLRLQMDHSSSERDLNELSSVSSISIPERDSDSVNKWKQKERDSEVMNILLKNYKDSKGKKEKELDKEIEIRGAPRQKSVEKEWFKETVNITFDINKDSLNDVFDLGPAESLYSSSSKSFTGSLMDMQSECVKEESAVPGLVRQSSYTILEPSPQLKAHLEVQSQNKGVAVTSISMSESLSSESHKKRRSWDLESAKKKWSSMANELKQNQGSNVKRSNGPVNGAQYNAGNLLKRNHIASSDRSQSVTHDCRITKLNNKIRSISDPIPKVTKANYTRKNIPLDITPTKQSISPTYKSIMKEVVTPKPNHTLSESPRHAKALVPISDYENSNQKIRELFEKIQSQQLMQMASLKEKQKQEQLFLEQIFDEQNNILLKQLKMICPKSPTEMRRAWGDENEKRDSGSGPVSLKQLNQINKSLPSSVPNSPASKTLSKTNNYINQCDHVLKQSRDITSSIKKLPSVEVRIPTESTKRRSESPVRKGNRNRSCSPSMRNRSRKLNYESASEYEPILTDRTNDTLADLNVTFPSDSEDSRTLRKHGALESSKDMTTLKRSPVKALNNGTDDTFKKLDGSIQHTQTSSMPGKKCFAVTIPPTTKNRAAATIIVAYAKGYLVRRLMRTERVQATVQTIRDALICALQLHQDREGIRGADVDLHRRLIQQITAACYSLHDTFVSASPAERCALIAADRARRKAAAARQSPALPFRQTDVMSRSHSGVFPTRSKRPSSAASLMTQSNYETFSGTSVTGNPRRRPWR